MLRAIKKSKGKVERKGLSSDFQGFNFQLITSRIFPQFRRISQESLISFRLMISFWRRYALAVRSFLPVTVSMIGHYQDLVTLEHNDMSLFLRLQEVVISARYPPTLLINVTK